MDLGLFSSKVVPVHCKTDRKIDGELLEYGVKFPHEMAANGLRETRKLFVNMPDKNSVQKSSKKLSKDFLIEFLVGIW